MTTFKRLSWIMEAPLAYRLWQAPFAKAKFKPILKHNEMAQIRRVLDVGCGPGTNAPWFEKQDYLGIDINPNYVAQARRRHQREFIVADVREYQAPPDQQSDFILLNSLMHHIDTPNVERILEQLSHQLTDDGHIHILDLVLPEEPSIARWLARSDRGDYPRALDEWKRLFTRRYDTVIFEPYSLGKAGVALWNMVYFKGRTKLRA